jgi:4a-hydroxytetrahydrobiopterin dehydratase
MDDGQTMCAACRGELPRLAPGEIAPLVAALSPGWRVLDGRRIEKTFTFDDFASALAFTNRAGDIAEAQGHHPEIVLSWGRVQFLIWTYAVDGLTSADFALAAQIDRL